MTRMPAANDYAFLSPADRRDLAFQRLTEANEALTIEVRTLRVYLATSRPRQQDTPSKTRAKRGPDTPVSKATAEPGTKPPSISEVSDGIDHLL